MKTSPKSDQLRRGKYEYLTELSPAEAILHIAKELGVQGKDVLAKMKHLNDFQGDVMVSRRKLEGRSLLRVFPATHSMTIDQEYPWHYLVDLENGEIVDDTDVANVGVRRLKAMRALKKPSGSASDDELGTV